MKSIIRIASAILLDKEGNLLVVRKKKSKYYMLPGGKIEPQETLIETLLRELHEELGIKLEASDFQFLGTHRTEAVNESDTTVEGNIFKLIQPLQQKINNQAEIEEFAWLSKKSYSNYLLAHLLSEFALPRWLNDFKD